MKPLLRKISLQSDSSFSLQHYSAPHFYNYWHFHPELELIWVQEGTGTRLVGDNVEPLKKGELLFIGSNLPHLFRFDDDCEQSEAVVIHVLEDFAGKDFIHLPEMRNIKDLFQRAQQGIVFDGKTRELVADMLVKMQDKTGIERLIDFLVIVKTLADCKDLRYLSKIGSQTFSPPSDTARINQIYAYILSHFSENLTVETMAQVANLSTTSFCRYFKKLLEQDVYGFFNRNPHRFCLQTIDRNR